MTARSVTAALMGDPRTPRVPLEPESGPPAVLRYRPPEPPLPPPSEALRTVEAIELADWSPTGPAPTGEPIFERAKPGDLLIEEAYQRNLSPRSIDLIGRITRGWDWRKFRPPVVAMTDAGLVIIDGQHTAIAAETHPLIAEIPIMVIEAPEIAARAAAFIGQNRDRIAVSTIQLHHAAVTAQDEDALTLAQVCQRAGVTLVQGVYGAYKYKPGETIAVGAIAALIDKRHAMGARKVLEILAQAEAAPVSAASIRAVDFLLSTPEFADEIEPEDLSAAIKALGKAADKEARQYAADHCCPVWRGLASAYFKKCKKRRKAGG